MGGIASRVDNLSILLLFLVLHLVLGALAPFKQNVLPFFWTIMQGAAGEIGRRLNRNDRSPQQLAIRGVVVTLVMISFALLLAAVVENISGYSYGWLAKLVFLCASAGVMPLVKMLRFIRGAIDDKKVGEAAQLLDRFLPESLAGADNFTLARKAMELAAALSMQAFIAPTFYFALAGVKGIAVYVAVASLAAGFDTADPTNRPFGGLPCLVARGLNFVPSYIITLLLSLSALVVSKAHPVSTWRIAISQHGFDLWGDRGWPIAAFAGALGVTLSGPAKLKNNYTVNSKWIGTKDASARVEASDLKRAEMLCFVVFLCAIVLFSGVFSLKIIFS